MTRGLTQVCLNDMRFHLRSTFSAFFRFRSRGRFSDLRSIGDGEEAPSECCDRFVAIAPAPVSPRGSAPKLLLFLRRLRTFCALGCRGMCARGAEVPVFVSLAMTHNQQDLSEGVTRSEKEGVGSGAYVELLGGRAALSQLIHVLLQFRLPLSSQRWAPLPSFSAAPAPLDDRHGPSIFQ